MSNKKVLFSVTKKDLEITYFSGHGKGGSNRNAHKNCVRIQHKASGSLVTAQECRERPQNIKAALHRLAEHPKFKLWVARRIYEIDNGKTVEEEVDEMMKEENLSYEILVDDKWVKVSKDYFEKGSQ